LKPPTSLKNSRPRFFSSQAFQALASVNACMSQSPQGCRRKRRTQNQLPHVRLLSIKQRKRFLLTVSVRRFWVVYKKRREVMWLWACELHQLGLRRLSASYWQCERRYGLPDGAYLSVFSHASEKQHTAGTAGRERLDVAAFHVTVCLGVDRVHFYFHEVAEGVWEPGGYTSALEIRRYCREPAELRALADRVVGEFLSALGMQLLPRGGAEEVRSRNER
jgi:hypothetical protein